MPNLIVAIGFSCCYSEKMTARKTILVSNDDGFQAEGIRALAQALSPLANVIVVAPQSNQSAVSHAISLKRPLRLSQQPPLFSDAGPIEVYSVDGTPSDSVYMAINHVLKHRPIDLIVSGINHGGNLGDDVFYSGTVSAAREGILLGVPAIAISLVANHAYNFQPACAFVKSFCAQLLANALPAGVLLNVNVPKIITKKELAITALGRHDYTREVERRVDPRGEEYFWIGGQWNGYRDLSGTDCKAIAEGYISVTPLNLNLTNDAMLPWLSTLQVQDYACADLYQKAENISR